MKIYLASVSPEFKLAQTIFFTHQPMGKEVFAGLSKKIGHTLNETQDYYFSTVETEVK